MEKSLIDERFEIGNEPMRLFAEFFGAVSDAHEKAVAKHPMTGMLQQDGNYPNDRKMMAAHLKLQNDNNEGRGVFSWEYVLLEEVYESAIEVAEKNWDAAQAEAVQVAQVAFRMWLWCEEMKQKKEVK